MINEKNLSAKQPVKGKKTWIPEKNVNKERKKNDQCQKEKGKKEIDSLIKIERTLKKGYQFRRVFRKGKAFKGVSFRAVYIKNTLGNIRLGFSLSAKSGNAVKRNLIRRRIKGLAAQSDRSIGADIVILPSGKLRDARWVDIRVDFEKMLSAIENDISRRDNVDE
jgi:ribonuclease P protein component